MGAGLLLAEVVVLLLVVLRSRDRSPLVRSSRPGVLVWVWVWPGDEATGEAAAGVPLADDGDGDGEGDGEKPWPGLLEGVDCLGDFLPFPTGVLLPFALGEGSERRRDSGTVGQAEEVCSEITNLDTLLMILHII